MLGMVELKTLICIAGYFNNIGETEPGEEETVGTRNREGHALVELMVRNGLAFVGSFFQKRESHKITYRSRHHKTELDLVLIRKQELWRIKDCKAIAGEHITTQHKPVVFVVRMKRTKPNKIVGRKTIMWWQCIYGIAIEYRERLKVEYEELGQEVDDLEEEWKKNTRMYLLEMRRSFVEDPRVWVENQEKIRNGGQPKSRQQYVKRRKPGRLLKRSRSTEISLTKRCCIYMDRRKKQTR